MQFGATATWETQEPQQQVRSSSGPLLPRSLPTLQFTAQWARRSRERRDTRSAGSLSTRYRRGGEPARRVGALGLRPTAAAISGLRAVHVDTLPRPPRPSSLVEYAIRGGLVAGLPPPPSAHNHKDTASVTAQCHRRPDFWTLQLLKKKGYCWTLDWTSFVGFYIPICYWARPKEFQD